MADHSEIEWTEATWNPMTGCTKVSQGCKNCYAERMARRLQAMGNPNYVNGFSLTLHEHALKIPFRWKKPRTIFVNSMSDLFHEDVPVQFIQRVFDVMREASWHTFQVLTKRSERLVELNANIDWPDNVWMGVSVETRSYTFRIDHLRQVGARVKFLSLDEADHASSEPFLSRAEEDALGRDAVVAAERAADLGIAEHDDIGGRPLAFARAGPVLQIPGPRQVREYEGVLGGLTRKNILQRLQVGRRRGKPRQID